MDDCYFYYYSSCTKADQCPFRHCAQALGSETVCSLWKEGRCRNATCKFRHMDIKVNRSMTPCYWETQPGGCTKPHCVFLHSFQKERGLLTQKNRSNPSPQPAVQTTVVSGGEMMTPGQRVPVDSTDELEAIFTPQVAPVVVNPFDEESDADSSTSGSPVKTTAAKHSVKKESREIAPGVKKVSRIAFARPQEKDNQSNFGIKSLEDIRREKLAHAKEVLAEADELLTSSVGAELLPTLSMAELEDDIDYEVKEAIMPQGSTRRIQLSSPSERLQMERDADSTTPATGGNRRIIVVDADSSAESAVASPIKQQPNVLHRLGGRAKEVIEPTTKDKGPGIHGRLGLKRLAAESRNAADEKPSSIKSRLGIKCSKAMSSEDDTEEDKPAPGIKSRLGLKRQAKAESKEDSSGEESPEPVRRRTLLSSIGTQSSNGSTDSSLKTSREAVRTSQSSIQGRLGKIEPISADTDGIKIKTWDEICRERGIRRGGTGTRSSPDTDKLRTARRKTRQTGVRVNKQEQEIYRPPAAKLEAGKTVVRLSTEPASRVKPESKAEITHGRETKKAVGWGVKTFSEIMAEKRQRRLGLQAGPRQDENDSDNAEVPPSVKARLGPLPTKPKPKRSFSPISFANKETENEPQPKKTRKFTPIVFSVEEGDSGGVQKSTTNSPLLSHRGGGDGSNQPQKRNISPISFDMTKEDKLADIEDDITSVTSSTEPDKPTVRRKKLTLSTRGNTPSTDMQPLKSPPLRSPTVKSPTNISLPVKSPTNRSPGIKSPGIKSPTITSPVTTQRKLPTPPTSGPASRRSSSGLEDRRLSLTKDTDDSFLNDVNDLLNDGEEITITTNYDDIGDDDLLNEMEELLA